PQRSPSEFMGTLSFLVHLSPAQAREQLQSRAQTLRHLIRAHSDVVKRVSGHVGRINLIESEYAIAMMKAELRWVGALLGELGLGTFRWDLRQILKQARAARHRTVKRKELSYEH